MGTIVRGVSNDETAVDWSARLTRSVAEAVRERRKALGMSAQVLSDMCAGLGHPIPRAVIARLENESRDYVTLAELLVLARALNLAPVQLIAPVGSVESVEVLPGQVVHPWSAWQWAAGKTFEWPVTDEPIDRDGYLEGVQPLRLWIEHAQLVQRWAEERSAVFARRLGDRELEHELLVARLSPIERELGVIREVCGHLGVSLPPLPDEIQAAMRARGGELDGERGEEA